jgi:hypothetical protein
MSETFGFILAYEDEKEMNEAVWQHIYTKTK